MGLNSYSGTSGSSPQAAAITWMLKKIDTTLTSNQIKELLKSISSNNGVFDTLTGWGLPMHLPILFKRMMFGQDSTVTFATCSGMQQLPNSHYFQFVDSSRYGLPQISGNTINTNLLAPGTYTYYFAWKSQPRVDTAYYDTLALKVVITGAGGITPSTTIAASATNVCEGSNFIVTASGNTGSATKTWYRDGLAVGAGSSISENLFAGTYVYHVVADLSSTSSCWTKMYDTSAILTVTVDPAIVPASSAAITHGDICETDTDTLSAASSVANASVQ